MSTVRDIHDILLSFEGYAADGDWTGIDDLLLNLDCMAEPCDSIIAHLRGSFPMRPKLKQWTNVAITAKKALIERYGRERTDSMLKGLPIPEMVTVTLK